jgi:ketosteroid isomerase-like protein
MRTHRYILAMVVTLLCSACATADEPALTDAERAAIADTIRELKRATVQAFDSQNCEFEYPVSDYLVTVIDGQLTKSQGPAPRAERIAGCQRINEQRLSATDDVQEEDVYVLGPDAAYIVTRSIYTVRLRDGRTMIRPQVATGIWARQADGWHLVHFHESWREVQERTTSMPKEGDTR